MKKFKFDTDMILAIIGVVLVIGCLVLEFVPIPDLAHKIVLAVTAVYALAVLVYFGLKRHSAAKKAHADSVKPAPKAKSTKKSK